MRALVQRVASARVSVAKQTVAEIAAGLLVLVGVTHSDDSDCAQRLAAKVRALRVFTDAAGRMNEPLAGREVLAVSQFTLYADTRHGTRPSFVDAAAPEQARALYELFCEQLGCARGQFGANMQIELVADGPVTVMLETHAPAAG